MYIAQLLSMPKTPKITYGFPMFIGIYISAIR